MATIVKGKNPRKPYTVRYQHESRQRERSFQTRREADGFIAKFEHDKRENSFVDPRKGTVLFTEYAGQWIDTLDVTERTRTIYRSVLRSKLADGVPIKGRTLAQVAGDVEGIKTMLAGMTCSASHKSNALNVITGTCNFGVQAGRISRHRLHDVKVRRDGMKAATIPDVSGKQLEALAAGLRPELALTVWLMLGCGLRISEALAVRLDGFSSDRTRLRVSEQVIRSRKCGPLKHRRAGDYRDVPVPAWLWAKVQDHVTRLGTDADGYLFSSPDGRRVAYATYLEHFKLHAGRAGLGDTFTCHDLRHLFASKLLTRGVPITDVSQWLGHADVRVTSAVYSHLLEPSWTRSLKALEELAA